jgi:hypothetical protein
MTRRIALGLLLLAGVALADDLPQPFSIGGGWQSCPVGFLIYDGRCLPTHRGPTTEYGCMEYVCKGSGECDARQVAECGAVTAWVGNVGDFGAPVVSLVGPGPAFVGPVIGISVVAPRVGRR